MHSAIALKNWKSPPPLSPFLDSLKESVLVHSYLPSLEMLTDVDSEGGQRHPSHPGACQPGPQWSLVGFQERGLFKWKLSEKRELGRRGVRAARVSAPWKGGGITAALSLLGVSSLRALKTRGDSSSLVFIFPQGSQQEIILALDPHHSSFIFHSNNTPRHLLCTTRPWARCGSCRDEGKPSCLRGAPSLGWERQLYP